VPYFVLTWTMSTRAGGAAETASRPGDGGLDQVPQPSSTVGQPGVYVCPFSVMLKMSGVARDQCVLPGPI